MAKVVYAGISHSMRGLVANAIVFQNWKGIYYCRMKPRYHGLKTPAIVRRNEVFADAVKAYQQLSNYQRMQWRKHAYGRKMSGYEAFLSLYLKSHS